MHLYSKIIILCQQVYRSLIYLYIVSNDRVPEIENGQMTLTK